MFWMWRLFQRVGGWRAFVAEALLAWRLFRDPRVPMKPKLIFPAALVYFFSPLNLPFEWIPIIGQIDDIGIAMLAVGAFLKLCPENLVAEHARALEAEFTHPERMARFGRYGRYVSPKFDRWTAASKGTPPAGPPPDDWSDRKVA